MVLQLLMELGRLFRLRESTDEDIGILPTWPRQEVLLHEHRPARLQEAVYTHCRAARAQMGRTPGSIGVAKISSLGSE